jgi:MFS family permease
VAVAAIFVLFMAASGVPSPLYVVYQQEWGFSDTTLTVVFAIYILGLLGALLTVGALSDHVGRRPVLAASIVLEVVSLVLFILANGVVVLAVARVAQGIATGAALTALAAALVDLNPPASPTRAGVVNSVAPVGGLAVGALGCGALVQYAPAPTRLVYGLLIAGMLIAIAIVARLPETSTRQPGALASLRPRVGLPTRTRAGFVVLLPIFIASWALGGLYLSLGPSVAASLFHLHSHLVGGLVVSLLCAVGGATAFVLRASRPQGLISPSAVVLAIGMAITLAGVVADSATLAAAGTVVAGLGFGAAALACFGTLARLATPDERGELFAAAYVIAYVSFSVPAVLAGFASTSYGLRATTEAYGAAVVVISLAALVAQRLIGDLERTAT